MRAADFDWRHKTSWRRLDAEPAASGVPRFATEIEIEHVPQAIQRDPVRADGQLRRAARIVLGKATTRAEVLDVTVAIELKADAGRTHSVSLLRPDHEREVEPRIPRAAVEVEPLR